MLIRTLRPCLVQGREVRAGLCLDLPPPQAEALIEAGDAERWDPPARGREPDPYLDAAEAASAATLRPAPQE